MAGNDENYSDQVIDWIKTNIFQSTSSTLLEKEVNFVKKFALSFQQEVNALWKNNSGRINYGLREKIDCFLNKVIDYENFVTGSPHIVRFHFVRFTLCATFGNSTLLSIKPHFVLEKIAQSEIYTNVHLVRNFTLCEFS